MGGVIASCGHEVFSGNDMIPVEFTDEEIDWDAPTVMFKPVTIMATFCPACAAKISEWPDGRVIR